MPHRPLGTEPSVRRKVTYQADRLLRDEAARFGDEVRHLRLRRGLTQADVARAIGVARSVVSRIEAGSAGASLRTRFRLIVVLGSRLRLPVYPDGTPILHDAPHARIVDRLLATRNPRWLATLEAPVPGPGARSTDVRLDSQDDVVLFEVESHVRQWEEIVRECQSKREHVRASAAVDVRVHSVLVLPPTRHHRELVAAHTASVNVAFPVASSTLEQVLRDPEARWPGDGLLWVAGGA
jgi:transcriptional regulator with XRE-family HTH domain